MDRKTATEQMFRTAVVRSCHVSLRKLFAIFSQTLNNSHTICNIAVVFPVTTLSFIGQFMVITHLTMKLFTAKRHERATLRKLWRQTGKSVCFPLCQRFRKFRSEFKWKISFRFLLTGIFGITSGVGPHISVGYSDWNIRPIGSKFVSFGIFIRLAISSSSSDRRLLDRKQSSLCWRSSLSSFSFIFTSAVFSRFAFGFTPVGDRWPRTEVESLGLAVQDVRGALEILRPVQCLTSRQCLRYKLREHSVANQYFLGQFFFTNRPFAIFAILNDNNSQLEQ